MNTPKTPLSLWISLLLNPWNIWYYGQVCQRAASGFMDDISTLLAVARGDAPADLLLSGGRVVNVFTGEIESTDIAISGGRIAGLGSGYQARHKIDLAGSFVAPGFIDAHVHIESSLCAPAQFATAVLPRGVTSVVTDPHEIGNVAGGAGVRFMARNAAAVPLDVFIMAPSCVPATNMASTGCAMGVAELTALRQDGIAHGLAEVMNYPAVIHGDADMLAKIAAMSGRPIDGHCPGVAGKSLNAYVAAGVGSDHECIGPAEAREKLNRGMYLLIREATNARNLDALLPVITAQNSRRICFCTDDRTPGHLLTHGSVDEMVRRAIAAGLDPIEAIRMVTLNPSEWFGLGELDAIAPGRKANLVVFDDLRQPRPRLVFSGGRLVARDGAILPDITAMAAGAATEPLGKCQVQWDRLSLDIAARSSRIRVIGSQRDQLTTEHRVMDCKAAAGRAVADVQHDVLKMMVIERHHNTGNIGIGFISGFGLRRGAIAGTVAHDHHNLISIGADDASMLTAAQAAAQAGGGLAVAVGEQVVTRLPLPIGGLMSDRPIAEVAAAYDRLLAAAREFGSTLPDPFMAMSFMGLEVIPALKLTDRGLVDVEKFQIVDLFVN
jgi:adenine deaminase